MSRVPGAGSGRGHVLGPSLCGNSAAVGRVKAQLRGYPKQVSESMEGNATACLAAARSTGSQTGRFDQQERQLSGTANRQLGVGCR
jgi:hypothetical protein